MKTGADKILHQAPSAPTPHTPQTLLRFQLTTPQPVKTLVKSISEHSTNIFVETLVGFIILYTIGRWFYIMLNEMKEARRMGGAYTNGQWQRIWRRGGWKQVWELSLKDSRMQNMAADIMEADDEATVIDDDSEVDM
jgi:hypothetical protein